MRLLVAIIALLSLVHAVYGFTDGVLLPDYICHPNENQAPTAAGIGPTGNLPKSLATYLPHVIRMSLDPLPVFAIDQPDLANGVLNTQGILANWHNRNISFTSTGAVSACVSVFQTNTTVTVGNATYTNIIVPGQVHQLTLVIRGHDFVHQTAANPPMAGAATCDVPISQVTSLDIQNLALDGAIIYAANSAGQRVGTFVATGDTMQYNPACGPWGVGVVHNQLVSCTGTYSGLTWAAPGNLALSSSVVFQGAGVSDAGFGKHSTTWPVVAALPASGAGMSLSMPIVTYATWLGNNLVVFFDPQTTAGVNSQVIAGSYTVTVQNSATAPTSAASVTATASPGTISFAALLSGGLTAGTNVWVIVTAQPVAGSTTGAQVAAPSLPYPVAVPAAAPSATVTLTQAAAVCNATYLDQTTFFSMNRNDNQCSYQSTLFLSGAVTAATVKAAASPVASVSVASTFITVVAVVAVIFIGTKRD